MDTRPTDILFGDLIATSRKLKGLTVKALIDCLKTIHNISISPAYVTKIEQYGEIPSPQVILALAEIFGLRQKELLASAKKSKLERIKKVLENKYEKALNTYEQTKKSRKGKKQ